jgi:hypothetical protein
MKTKGLVKSLMLMLSIPAMILSAAAHAETTVFTLGPPTVNYVPVLTQDGVPTNGLWSQYYVYDCALKQECYGVPQHEIEIILPAAPFRVGGCMGTVLTDTRPPLSKYREADGILQSSLVCYNGVTGVITYSYQSVLQKHCSAGHPACASLYWPVLVSGSGTLTSTP